MAWIALATLWILLGAWCAEMEPQPAPAPVISALSDGLLRTVEGTVVDAGPVRAEIDDDLDPTPSPLPPEKPTQRVDLRLSSIENVTDENDAQVPADGIVRLTLRWPSVPGQPFRCGERLRADIRPLPPQVYRDPGAWNRQDYLLSLGITSTATAEAIAWNGSRPHDKSRHLAGWDDLTAQVHCRLADAQRTASSRLLALPAATRKLPRPFASAATTPSCSPPWSPATAPSSPIPCA